MKKIFFLTSGPSVPVIGARRIRDAQIITSLAEHLPVEILCLEEKNQLPQLQKEVLNFFGPNVQISCHPPYRTSLLSNPINLIRPDIAKGFSKSIARHLKEHAQPGDLIWCSRLRMAKYLKVGKKLKCKTVLDAHQVESDVLFDNAFTELKYWHQGLSAIHCAWYEKKLSSEADLVVTSSKVDAVRMRKLAPKSKPHVIPHSIPPTLFQILKKRKKDTEANQILFFGDFDYQPKQHALEWFLEEVHPRLELALPKNMPRILVASSSEESKKKVKDLHPQITFFHYENIEELLEVFNQTIAVVFPLRYGRGNRINILEALSAGLPIVSTGRGVDGLVLNPGYDVCVAEDEDHFSTYLLRIIQDQGFREKLSSHAQETAERYSWKKTDQTIQEALLH